MRIKEISIKNFRLLEDVTVSLSDPLTVIVGRNNSGKTSLNQILHRVLGESDPRFRLEDFSLSAYEALFRAYKKHMNGGTDEDVRKVLPEVEVLITLSYTPEDHAALAGFVIDLDPAVSEARIRVTYRLRDGQIAKLFSGANSPDNADDQGRRHLLFRAMRTSLPRCYGTFVSIIDPADRTDTKPSSLQELRTLIRAGFISAQRGFDDSSNSSTISLGKVLESLFHVALDSTDENDTRLTAVLQKAVAQFQQDLDSHFNGNVLKLLPSLAALGYPGLGDQALHTETTLDLERLLSDHTRVLYAAGAAGENLPEAHSGLGTRNLIFMLLRLLEFYKSHCAQAPAPAVDILFIEEPEVHLHPQMQQVFIAQLSKAAEMLARTFGKRVAWPVQFVVTTHSSHIAHRAELGTIRYFLARNSSTDPGSPATRVKDLADPAWAVNSDDKGFVQKYMTLSRCDLFFADKAILVEGAAERLLMQRMVEKTPPCGGECLTTQYVTTLEVSGAYAHRFFALLKFLEIPALVITDLDAVDAAGKACPTSKASQTSNACIKSWFPGDSLAKLAQHQGGGKIRGAVRLAYQIPETTDAPCARSFEDALYLANPGRLASAPAPGELEQAAYDAAAKINSKTTFALDWDENHADWAVPKYIAEGLAWLASAKGE